MPTAPVALPLPPLPALVWVSHRASCSWEAASISTLQQLGFAVACIAQDQLAQGFSQQAVVIAHIDVFKQLHWLNPTVVWVDSSVAGALPAINACWREHSQHLLTVWQLGQSLGASDLHMLHSGYQHYIKNEDVRLIHRAGETQAKLFPPPLQHQGWHISGQVAPLSILSGDCYHYWRSAQGNLMFYLADVAGHGIRCSMLTAWLRALSLQHLTLAEWVQLVNTELCQLKTSRHIALFAGCYNPHNNTLQWLNAGMLPPAIIAEPAGHTLLPSDDGPLGITPLLPGIHTTTLLPTQALYVFSDGILDSHPNLATLCAQLCNGEVPTLHALQDDTSLLVLRPCIN